MKSAIQFLLYTAKGFKSRIGIILIIGLAEVVLSLAFVWISKAVIDVATGERAGELLQYSLVLVGLVLLQILVRVWDSRLRKMTRMRLGNSVRYNVFSRLLHTRWQELSTLHSGDMLTRIIKDTDDVTEVTVNAFSAAILAVVQLLGALAILIFLDPTLALILGGGGHAAAGRFQQALLQVYAQIHAGGEREREPDHFYDGRKPFKPGGNTHF